MMGKVAEAELSLTQHTEILDHYLHVVRLDIAPTSRHSRTPDCRMNQRSVIPAEAGIQKLLIEMDSRFRGNDGLKKTIRTCG